MASDPKREVQKTAGFASPACLLHEVDSAYAGLAHTPLSDRDVYAWRKTERVRLIAARQALSAEERTARAQTVARHLDTVVPRAAGTIVSVYWPFRGEFDLRPWMASLIARDIRVALPVVAAKARPLVFREWRPHCRLEKGIWDIPVPADGAEITPTVVIAPLVGYDHEGYRLGHGGGFFDRTLAHLAQNQGSKPLAIGVGYAFSVLATIHPRAHDIPMDVIVTDTIIDHRRKRRTIPPPQP